MHWHNRCHEPSKVTKSPWVSLRNLQRNHSKHLRFRIIGLHMGFGLTGNMPCSYSRGFAGCTCFACPRAEPIRPRVEPGAGQRLLPVQGAKRFLVCDSGETQRWWSAHGCLLLKWAEIKALIAQNLLWCSSAEGVLQLWGHRRGQLWGLCPTLLSQPKRVFLLPVCLHVSCGEFICYLAHLRPVKSSKSTGMNPL